MPTLFRTPSGRLVALLTSLLCAFSVAGSFGAWREAAGNVRTVERTRLTTAVSLVAPFLDGDLHRTDATLPPWEAFDTWDEAPVGVRAQRARLVDAHGGARLSSPLLTLRLRESHRSLVEERPRDVHRDAMELVLTTDDATRWRHTIEYVPRMAPALLEGEVTTTSVYEDAEGEWISAYAPVRDSAGRIVGVLAADAPLHHLLAAVRGRLFKQLLATLALVVASLLAWWRLLASLRRLELPPDARQPSSEAAQAPDGPAEAEQAPSAAGTVPPGAVPQPPAPLPSETFRADVLLVEDSRVNQRIAERLLMKLGCRVSIAGDGVEALELLDEKRFDLVLMDCLMPVMDGYEATRMIREGESEGGPRLPVVALTANAFEEDRKRAFDAGMDDFLVKPATIGTLRETLRRWCVGQPRASQRSS